MHHRNHKKSPRQHLEEGQQLCRRDGRGPLHWACRHGRLEMLQFLLDQGVGRLDDRAADGTTMLMLASCLVASGSLLGLGVNPLEKGSRILILF